jgi:hypothetical protein
MLWKMKVFLLLFLPLVLWAQTAEMTVHEKGGNAFTVSPDQIRKIVIVKDRTPALQIVLREGSQSESELTEIDKIVFYETTRVEESGSRFRADAPTFVLQQNYPNPFNPSTTIEYELSASGRVQVQIYNLNGQMIRTFESGVRSDGLHRSVWDGKDEHGLSVSGGVYVCRARFGDSVQMQKLLLVK